MSAQKTVTGLAVRTAAARALQEVLGGAAFSPLHAGDLPDPRDRALANRLVTAALRRHGHINVILEQLLDKGLPPRSGLFEAHLRLGLTQLLFLPDLGAHSAIYLAVEGIRRDRRASRYGKLANGVLRHAQREAESFTNLDPNLLFPGWLCTRWRKAYGDAAIPAFAEALLAGAPLDLTLKVDNPALVERLGALPVMADTVRLTERDAPVSDLPGYETGDWWVQDSAAAIPARLFDLPEGARSLDLCAAPGGKSAQLVKAGYQVTALDNDPSRLKRVEENLARLGYWADLIEADAADYSATGPFDGILVDAPCSSTGTFRRHPEVVWLRKEKDLSGRMKLQRRILANAAKSLRPGGTLVFCTCSLEPEEGEDQARWIAENLPDLEPFPLVTADLPDLAEAVTSSGHLRTHPAMTVPGKAGGTLDGFFASRFRHR